MTIQVTLVDFKWSVGRYLVIGQDCLVHELHERRITDPRVLDRLAKTQNMRSLRFQLTVSPKPLAVVRW